MSDLIVIEKQFESDNELLIFYMSIKKYLEV